VLYTTNTSGEYSKKNPRKNDSNDERTQRIWREIKKRTFDEESEESKFDLD